MSLSSALSIALSGLQVSSAQLQLASNNIANAQTAGYTEKSASITPLSLGDTGAGVSIGSYNRSTSTILTQSYNTATTSAGYLNTQNGYMGQVQSILNSNASNPGLSAALAQFSSAWTQLQSEPEDTTQQQTVIQAGQALANQISSVASQVNTLDSQIVSDTNSTITELNNDINTVYQLNQQMTVAISNNQPTGNIEDARDQAINQIAAITNVTVLQRANGQVALYTSSGSPLLDGIPSAFTYNGTDVLSGSGQTVTNDLTGGSLQAELQFRATASTPSTANGVNVIQKLNAQLKTLTSAFTTNSAGPPQTFANAFNPTNVADENFFTIDSGGDPGSLTVNPDLVDGTISIDTDNVTNVASSFASTFNFNSSSSGLSSVGNATYAQLGTTILSNFQAAANAISTQSTTATQQQTYYQQSLANATGVNVDNELVNLTTYQNSYAASAHVISTIAQMYNDLMSVI
jgi:flagellar hook-associated protein 1 FlgK